jgi:hypothetical protein
MRVGGSVLVGQHEPVQVQAERGAARALGPPTKERVAQEAEQPIVVDRAASQMRGDPMNDAKPTISHSQPLEDALCVWCCVDLSRRGSV